MDRYIGLWTRLALLLTVVILGRSQLNPTPSDSTAEIGTDVTLQCGYTGSEPFEWNEYITESTGISIFITPPDEQPENSNKFGIEGTYNLIVKQPALTDGGKYGCRSFDMPSYELASLVILEKPSLLIPSLTSGVATSISCMAYYGGPLDASEGHTPNIRLAIDDNPVSVTPEHTLPNPGPPESYELGYLSVTYNYTADRDHNQRNMTCEVYTDSPYFEVMDSEVLNVRYPVENIAINPVNTFYYIGEQLNCSADGNPDPEFRWTPLLSPGGITVSGPTLTIQPNMVGQNEWECTATNTVENTEVLELTIAFEVLDTAPPGSGQSRFLPCRCSILLAFLLALASHVI